MPKAGKSLLAKVAAKSGSSSSSSRSRAGLLSKGGSVSSYGMSGGKGSGGGTQKLPRSASVGSNSSGGGGGSGSSSRAHGKGKAMLRIEAMEKEGVCVFSTLFSILKAHFFYVVFFLVFSSFFSFPGLRFATASFFASMVLSLLLLLLRAMSLPPLLRFLLQDDFFQILPTAKELNAL